MSPGPARERPGPAARTIRELRPAIALMREYLEAPPQGRSGQDRGAPRLLLEGPLDGGVVPAAAFVAQQLDRPLFRLDLRLLRRPEDVASSIAALLAAAANVGAVAFLEAMDVLVPGAAEPGRAGASEDRWPARLTALAVREALHAHPLPVIVGVTSTDGLHPLVAQEIRLTVSLPDGVLDDR